MRTLSTGDDSTLGSYLKLAKPVFGEDSVAVKFLERKIAESPNGENEEVLADERQMIAALAGMTDSHAKIEQEIEATVARKNKSAADAYAKRKEGEPR